VGMSQPFLKFVLKEIIDEQPIWAERPLSLLTSIRASDVAQLLQTTFN